MYTAQLRAARALLDWTQDRLADESKVSVRTIKRLEAGSGLAAGTHENVMSLQRALEKAGVVFLSEPGQIGVTLRIKSSK